MNVLVRSNRIDKGLRRRRAAAGSTGARIGSEAAASPRSERRSDDASPARRRLHGPTQDRALYTCQCGYVFEATVSTSVDCPHCGGGQAW